MQRRSGPAFRSRSRVIWLLVTAAIVGCGAGGEETLYPVAGRVTLQGKGLPVGSLTFRPDAARGNRSLHHPVANIGPGGDYELYTTGRRGAPPGWYRVLVFADANALGGGRGAHPPSPRWLIHEKYTDARTTDLFVEVVAAPAPGQYDLQVSR